MKNVDIYNISFPCPFCNKEITGKFKIPKYSELHFFCSRCVTEDGDHKFSVRIDADNGNVVKFTYIDDFFNTLHCDLIGIELTSLPKYSILTIDGVLPSIFFDDNYSFNKDKADKYIKYKSLY